MAPENIINNSFWTLSFHLIVSLFYTSVLWTFMCAKNSILTGRMITTWYLVFHVGFIFLRLIQDLINLTPAKNWKFNEIFAKFNNLFFISLIFPFALYIPFVYWLLFYYDSNLMLPNFVEISLPSWVSTSSHSAIVLVALLEMMATKYVYDGNNFSSLIIMSTFSAGYIVCLVGTYMQYGFWLYPIFHLTSANSLPFVFLTLWALLLLMYIVGKFIAEHRPAIAPVKGHKDDGKFPNTQYAENTLAISNCTPLNIENDDLCLDSQFKGSQRYCLAVLKKILKKTVQFLFRSNVQNCYAISNTEIKKLKQCFRSADEINSILSFTETKKYRICNPLKNCDALELKEDTAGANCKSDAKDNHVEKTSGDEKSSDISENILTSRNDNDQINNLNLSEEHNRIPISNSQADEDIECSVGYVEYEAINPGKEPLHIVNNDGHHDVDKKDGEVNPHYTTCRKECPSFTKFITDESYNNENADSNDRPKRDKKHNGSSFRFRLQLFPNSNSSEAMPSNERYGTKKTLTDEISTEKETNSELKKDDQSPTPTPNVTASKQNMYLTQSSVNLEKGVQSITENLDLQETDLTSDCDKNSSLTSTSRGSSGTQKRNSFAKFFESNKFTSKMRMPKYHRRTISRNSTISVPNSSKLGGTEEQKKTLRNNDNHSDTSGVKQYELRTVGTDHTDVNNYCGIKKPKTQSNLQFCQKSKQNKPSTSKAIYSVVENSYAEEERSKTKKEIKCDENEIPRHKHQQLVCQSKSKTCDKCNLKKEENHNRPKRNTKAEFFRYEPKNEKKKTVEYKDVKCHNVRKVKEQKLEFNEKIKNPCSCVCQVKEGKSQIQKKKCQKRDTKSSPDGCINKNDYKKLKYKKSDKENDFPQKLCQNLHTPRTCEKSLNEKALEKRNEKLEEQVYEKTRYATLPKSKGTIEKTNISNYLRPSDKKCGCKKVEPAENKGKNLTEDLPALSCSCNHISDRTKNKFVAKFFKFSKFTRKNDGKQLVEILKKCANGSKIDAVLAAIPANIDINNADRLQNLQAAFLSDHAKLFKFCIVLS